MGCDVVGDAILYLHIGGIWARRGYPGRLMPHITDAVVAINVDKVTPEGTTVVAEVCAPMTKGVFACEDMADRVAQIWAEKGAVVTYGGHRFDGKSGLYQTSVYGYWAHTAEEETEDVGTEET